MTATEPSRRPGEDLVGGLAILRLLPEQVRDLVACSFVEQSFAFGEYIVVAGQPADAFYVLIEGLARVIAIGSDGRETSLDLLRPGDSFGERALLEGSSHVRSVRASGPAAVARLDRGVFTSLTRLYPEVREAFAQQARAARLRGFFRMHSTFSVLGADAVSIMLRDATERRVVAGERLFSEGDSAATWFVVEDGRLTVFATQPRRRDLRFLRTGDLFGELAVLGNSIRTASVEATSDAALLELPASTLHALLEQQAFRERIEERRAIYERGPGARPVDAAPSEGEGSGNGAATAASPPRRSTDEARVADGVQLADAPAGSFEWRAPRRFPLVRQIDMMDCGAACTAMLCRAFGHNVSLGWIRQAVGTGQTGTSLAGIKRGGEQIGLQVTPVKSSVSRIGTLALPAIIHWERRHWVVLYEVGSDQVRIADPAGRLRRVPMDEVAEKWSGYAAVARPTPRLSEAPRERLDVGWLWPLVRPHRGRLAIAVAMALLATAGVVVPPTLSQQVIDAVIQGRGAGRVNLLVAVMVVVLVGSLAASLVQRRVLARLAVELDSDALDFVTGRLLGLPLSYFESRRTGDIERRLNGLREMRQLLVQSFPAALAGTVQLLFTLVIMFSFSWVIGVAFLATAPVYAALMRYSSTLLRPIFDELEEAYGRHASKQIDAIKGIEAVKTAGAEPGMRKRILAEFTKLAHKVFKADFATMSYDAATQLASFLIFVAFLWIAALLAVSGSLSVGQVVAINSLVLLANGPIFVILGLWDRLQIAAVMLQRLQDVLDQELEQPAPAQLHRVPSLEGRISLKSVALAYRDAPDKPALDGVTLEIEPGMSLGLVGRSGSGKSSLLRCLAGLIVPTAGAILYDGVDLRELRWDELRRRVGFVLQEPYLFDDSVAANIALGDEEPDRDQVIKAAEIAAASEFVEGLPFGYDTLIGDSGLRLSGGQAQRIAIARALYHEPPVVLFDEATSALDSESERSVKENLDRVMTDRTTVVVAHRLSTVRDADAIGVLERGRLVELGTHEQLMAREGLYYYLNTVQLEG